MPLPNPQEGESRNDFMGRCVIDPNIINDFDTIEQRVAVCSTLYDPQKETKAQDNWEDEFENELTKAERTSVRDFTEFYKAEYNDAIDLYLKVGQMTQATAQGFFQDAKYVEMYSGMYSKIGLRFANWYSKNVQKYMPKADPGNMQSIWANAFAFMGQQVAGQRVTMVSSTAQATLTNTIRQFMADPIFMSAGEAVQSKMLRQKFDGLADYQARRIVRTESTNAANYATEQAALNLFAGQDMTKTWKSGFDARVRDAHRAANNQVVPFNGKFSVGGESLQRPGDPNGSASNVINCRCSMIVLPNANANTIGPQITNIGFGMAQAEVVDAISSAMIAPEIVATVVAETAVIDFNAQKEAMRPDNWNDIIGNNKINDDFLALLPQKGELIATNNPISDALGYQVRIGKYQRNGESLTRVITHEFGHVIHHERGWLTMDFSDPIIDQYFKKHQNLIGLNLRGEERMKALRDFNFKLNTIDRSLFPELTDKQFMQYSADVSDFFGALSKNKVGNGHDTSYYVGNKGKYEYVAHAFENKYAGNVVMQKMYPEFFKDTLEMLELLIKK